MSRATCLAMLCALSAHAVASPRSDPTAGRAVFTGAASPNATSIDLNPAALGIPSSATTLGIPDELYVAAMATLDSYSVDRKTLDIDTGALSTGDSISANLVSPGGMFTGIWHTGDEGRVTIAGGLRSSPAERFIANEEALRYHTLGGQHRAYSVSAAVSLRVSQRVYVGVSFAFQSTYLKLRYARDTALDAARDPVRGIDSDCDGAPCGVENPAATELYAVDVSSGTGLDLLSASNLIANLGAAVQVATDVWVGAAYHSPPGLAVENELTGTMAVDRAPRDGGGKVTGASTVYLSQPASVDLAVRARLPQQLDLHVGTRWEDLSRLRKYDVYGYGSLFPAAGIPEWMPRPRGLHDTFSAWAGVEQVDFGEPVRFGARLGIETSAVDDARMSAMTVAPLSFTADAGAQLRIGTQVVVQLTYGLQLFPAVDVAASAFDPRARLSCFDSEYDYSTAACRAVRDGYALPTAAGDYQRLGHAARLAIRYEIP